MYPTNKNSTISGPNGKNKEHNGSTHRKPLKNKW